MELTKTKYKKAEVQAIIDQLKTEYEEKLSERRTAEVALDKVIEKLKNELEVYKNRDALEKTILSSAEKKAEEIRETAERKYAVEIEYLKAFNSKWRKYFRYLAETYPYYKSAEEAVKISKVLAEVLGKKISNKQKIETLNAQVKDVQKTSLDPLAITVSESGFDLNDVLNPGELDLEDLCKELGVME